MREHDRTGRHRRGKPARPVPSRGSGFGYHGGALRSRGSYQAGQLRSGSNPVDEFEFEWGEGYVGGRGYGGTNYDLRHGYRVRGEPSAPPREGRGPIRLPDRESAGGYRGRAPRGGFEWGEEYRRLRVEPYGPSRYGYGPYFDRLRRRRRPDEDIRTEVKETLFYDTWVDADRIEAEVDDGIVTLRGTLKSFDEVRYATDDAWDVDGVIGVRCELRVDGADGLDASTAVPRKEQAGAAGSEESTGSRPEGGE